MQKRITLLFFALVFVCLSATNVLAQLTATATLQGTVTDKLGAVIPGAEVRISNEATGEARSGMSNGAGLYSFNLLSAGIYELRVSVREFTTTVFENVEVFVGRTTTIDAQLSPSPRAETITVEASGAALVDVVKTDASRAVSPIEVQELPVNSRDFVSLAVLAPGVRPTDSYDPTKNRMGVFSINGSNGRNVNMTVNGIDNKDNLYGGPVMQLPLEAIQEFNISTQRFSAANGRSEGAAINVITRSGTNNLHGSLYLFDRSDALNTLNYFEKKENGGDGTKSPYSRQQFGGSVGGPMKKDRTFLFFALERSREQTSINVNPTALMEMNIAKKAGFPVEPSSTIPTPYFDWRYNGRLDHKIDDKNSLALSYSNQNNRGENDQSSSTTDLTAGNFTTNQIIISNMSINSVITPNIVNSFTAGFQYWNNLIDTANKVPTFTFPSMTFGTNVNVPQQNSQRKWQFKDDISFSHGRHTFKTGVDYVWEPAVGGFFISNPTIHLTFFDDPSTITTDTKSYPQGFATPGAIQTITDTAGDPYYSQHPRMFGVYFQDDWKATRRLTLNLGVRYDRDTDLIGAKEQARARAYLLLKAIGSPYGGGLPHDDNKDISPRVGLAFDITGHGKHILRAGYGLYFGQTFQNIPLFMEQQTNPTLFTTVSYNSNGPADTNADVIPSTGKPLSQFRYGVDPLPGKPAPATQLGTGGRSYITDPKYRNPYTEQWNGGYTWAIDNNQVIEVEYVHVFGLHESRSIVINPKEIATLGGARFTDAPLEALGLPQIGPISDSESIGRSRYDGLNISYRKHMSRHFTVDASYVRSRGVAWQSSAAAFGDRPTDLNNIFAPHDFGPAPDDEPHRFVMSGIVDLPWGFKFAPIMQAASAKPYNLTEGIADVYGFGGLQGSTHAIVLNSDPTNYLATKNFTSSQLRACLAANTCQQVSYDVARGQAFFELDARFSRRFTFGEKMRLDIDFQAFDLTDRANFGNNFQGNIRSSLYGTPIGFITPSGVLVPRSFSGEFGAKFNF